MKWGVPGLSRSSARFFCGQEGGERLGGQGSGWCRRQEGIQVYGVFLKGGPLSCHPHTPEQSSHKVCFAEEGGEFWRDEYIGSGSRSVSERGNELNGLFSRGAPGKGGNRGLKREVPGEGLAQTSSRPEFFGF